jgi:hypothetical protein
MGYHRAGFAPAKQLDDPAGQPVAFGRFAAGAATYMEDVFHDTHATVHVA